MTDAEVLIIDLINCETNRNGRRTDVTPWFWVRVSCPDEKHLAREDQSNRMTFSLGYDRDHREGEILNRHFAFVRVFTVLCGYGRWVRIIWAHPHINIFSWSIVCSHRWPSLPHTGKREMEEKFSSIFLMYANSTKILAVIITETCFIHHRVMKTDRRTIFSRTLSLSFAWWGNDSGDQNTLKNHL